MRETEVPGSWAFGFVLFDLAGTSFAPAHCGDSFRLDFLLASDCPRTQTPLH